jgi:hypothetical protein
MVGGEFGWKKAFTAKETKEGEGSEEGDTCSRRKTRIPAFFVVAFVLPSPPSR